MNEQVRSHHCPVTGCCRSRRAGHVLCAHHWYKVPAELRNRIWKLYRDAAGSPAHRAAVFQAIEHVIDLEASASSGKRAST